MPRHTLVHQLQDWATRRPDSVALRDKARGAWRERTWRAYWEDVRAVAKGLIDMGHQSEDCVAIVGDNRIEWVLLELGIMTARGIPAPIYTTNTAEQAGYIVRNARASIVICDGREQLLKLRTAVDAEYMAPPRYITMDAIDDAGDDVTSYDALVARGRALPDDAVDARVDAIDEEQVALLIYTSGTTGKPKGVMLDHGGLVTNTQAVLELVAEFDPALPNPTPYRTLSYLPLCHAAEQLLTTMGHLQTGGVVTFCPDLKLLKDYLVEVRPTIFLGVPRVWEKFEAALSARLAATAGVKGALARWARDTELEAARTELQTGRPHTSLARTLAQKLVIGKLKQALGLDALAYAITGSAPIGVATLEFFASLGITIHEAYGMSETSGVCTVTPPRRPRFGRVGTAIRGVEIRIADDGEVLLRGRAMTRGYLHLPDESRELYTDDGWLRTGDIGDVDSDGYLAITGRKKELLITAGGKNVAPSELEAYLQQIPGVGQAVVVGDRKPYLAALLTLDVEHLPELARRVGCPPTLEGAAASAEVRAWIGDAIETTCNARVARYQTIKRFEILPVEFTVDGGELTPTMKLKRTEVAKKYKPEIERLFDEPGR